MKLREKRLQVLKALKEGTVDILFIKANGEERRMKASKNPEDGAPKGLNSKEEIEKSLSTGTVPVYDLDKADMRAFNFARLKGFKPAGASDYFTYDETEVEKAAAREGTRSGKEIDVMEQIKRLNKKVVRLVFLKKDGTERVMFATRNFQLIDTYMDITTTRKESEQSMNSPEKIAAQVAKDYVNVFDLQARAFKMYKPSQLCEIDSESGVGSWLEFNPDDDGWFLVMRNEKPVKSVYKKNSFTAKPLGKGISNERVLIENRNRAYKTIQANQKLRGDEEDRYKEAMKKVDYICANLKEKYTSYDLAVFDKLKAMASKIQADFKAREAEGRENANIILSEVKVLESKKLVILNYNWGKDIFVFNPRFALNAISHKVFIDRTKVLRFESIRRSPMTQALAPTLKEMLKYIAKRRKKGAEDLKLNEVDVDRLKRYAALLVREQDRLRQVGLNGIFANKGKVQAVAFQNAEGANFFISPLYVFDNSTKVKRFIYQRASQRSTLKPLLAFLQQNAANLKLTKEQADLIMRMTIVAFNRKRSLTKVAAQ